MRKRVRRAVDRRVFARTANRVRKANIIATAARGGIRL